MSAEFFHNKLFLLRKRPNPSGPEHKLSAVLTVRPERVTSFERNDCARGEDGQRRVTQVQTLLNSELIFRDASAGLATLMVGPPPVSDDEAHTREIIALSLKLERLCDRLGVPFFSSVPFVGNADSTWRAEAALSSPKSIAPQDFGAEFGRKTGRHSRGCQQ